VVAIANSIRGAALGVALGLLSSCASSSAANDRPAVIINADAKSRLALQNAVSKSIGVAYVVLGDDALTKESNLIIEPARIRDFEGRLLQGRETRGTELFHLVMGKKKDECILVHERTGAHIPLADTHCKSHK